MTKKNAKSNLSVFGLSLHALDDDAVAAFENGRGVFDLHPGNLRLTQFFQTHSKLKGLLLHQITFPFMMRYRDTVVPISPFGNQMCKLR